MRTYIREENEANNTELVRIIAQALSELTFGIENNIYLGDKKLADVLADAVIKKMSRNVKYKLGASGA